MKKRLNYLILVVVTIGIGLFSRRLEVIPFWIGDSLWAVMVYLIVRIILINKKQLIALQASILFSYLIELSQVLDWNWLVMVRKHVIGRLILGQGFLWSDIMAYTLGIIIIYSLDSSTRINNHMKQFYLVLVLSGIILFLMLHLIPDFEDFLHQLIGWY